MFLFSYQRLCLCFYDHGITRPSIGRPVCGSVTGTRIIIIVVGLGQVQDTGILHREPLEFSVFAYRGIMLACDLLA